jgi:HlyD family secretion protein
LWRRACFCVLPQLRRRAVNPTASALEVTLAADGRIEGTAETVQVGSVITGVIESVAVREGQRVAAGTVLAQVRCSDLEAEMRSVASAQEVLRQEQARMLRGRRAEERRIAAAQVTSAKADLR